MKKIALMALAGTLTMFQWSAALADHCHCLGHGYSKEVMMKLDLTDEQKDKLKSIKEKAMDEMKPLKKEMKHIHHEMKELADADTMDEMKLDKLIHDKKELMGKMTKMKAHMKHDIRHVLTDQQKEELKSLMKDHKDMCDKDDG